MGSDQAVSGQVRVDVFEEVKVLRKCKKKSRGGGGVRSGVLLVGSKVGGSG